MSKVIELSKPTLASVVHENREKYCIALESAGVYGACNEGLGGLIELLEPFLVELSKEYSLNRMIGSIGSEYKSEHNFTSPRIFEAFVQMGLISENYLTQEGHDIINLYRKKKNLPSIEEHRNDIINRVLEHSKSLDW